MRSTAYPAHAKRFYSLLQKTYGIYLKRSFRVKILKENVFEPPYILLANHLSSFDPFIIASFIKQPVSFVASDAYFRNPFLRFLLNKVGSIPKTKFLSDMATAKAMINVKNRGGIIGVFPEGARSWDGHTLPLVFSTAKLIKLLKADVITARFDSIMFTKPRWSRYRKKGITYLSFEKTIGADEISGMSADDIYSRISASLSHDEYGFQREHMNRYTGRNPSERLERFLFFCPSCKGFQTMRSRKDLFKCHKCGYEVRYGPYGFFEGDDVIYDDTRKWNSFQHDELKKMMVSDLTVKANNILMLIGSKEFKRLQRIKIGSIYLTNDSFYFINLKKEKFIFDTSKMSGLNIQSNNKLEFYLDNVFYRMIFAKSNISAYAVKSILVEIMGQPGSENG